MKFLSHFLFSEIQLPRCSTKGHIAWSWKLEDTARAHLSSQWVHILVGKKENYRTSDEVK